VLQDIRTVKVTDENFATVERVAHWWAGWRMWEDHPWTGIGIGNYATAYPNYNLAGWDDPLGHAHNFYINMGAEAGTLGFAAYLIFLAAAFLHTCRSLLRASSAWQRALALGILGILAARLIQDGLDNLWVHAMGIQVALLLGLLPTRSRG
jgi:O-antigen ligase